jgi:hypothetical protein
LKKCNWWERKKEGRKEGRGRMKARKRNKAREQKVKVIAGRELNEMYRNSTGTNVKHVDDWHLQSPFCDYSCFCADGEEMGWCSSPLSLCTVGSHLLYRGGVNHLLTDPCILAVVS